MVSDYHIVRKVLGDPKNPRFKLGYDLFNIIAGEDTIISTSRQSRNKHARKASRHALGNSTRIKAINERLFQDLIETVWERSADTSTPVEVDVEMLRLALRVSAEVVLDYKLLREEVDMWVNLMCYKAKEAYLRYKGSPVVMVTWKWAGWMFPWFRRADRTFEEVRGLIKNMMRSHDPNEMNSVYSGILADIEYQSDEERLADCCIYFMAGFDTTTNAIVWTLRELARHPQEQTKLREELRKCQTGAERRHCPALKNVVRESMRLNPPPAAGSVFSTAKDTPIPDSSDVISAGSVVWFPTYVINRDKDVYGDNADEFVPSRWDNPSEAMLKSFLPFSMGGRKCPGQPMATVGLYMIISELISRYELEVVDEGVGEFYLFIWKCEGVKLAVKRVDQINQTSNT